MPMLWQLPASELARGYGAGKFTPVDVATAVMQRADALQPSLNALVWLDRDGALQAAQASATRWARGAARGPLDGIPITLKDNLHAAGMPTGWGSRLRNGYRPTADELPVRRLREAGAVLLGKTNLPEFAMQGITDNLVHGATRNPWATTHTPGGSSGGAAAAVAAGIGPLALATDGGGSIRRPAAHTGLVGFKPSADAVPRAGGLPEIFMEFEVVGGMARTVTDLQALMRAIGHERRPTPPEPPARPRILFIPQFAHHPVDPAIAQSARQAADRFAAMGCDVEQAGHFDLAEQVNALWPTLSGIGLAWMLNNTGRFAEFARQAPDPALMGPAAREAFFQGRQQTGAQLFEVLDVARVLRQRLRELFTRADWLLTPATAAPPWPLGATHPGQIAGQAAGPRGHAVFTAFANAAGLPALALPCEPAAGFPNGVQLIGPAGSDEALLALAARFELQHPWAQRWPELDIATP